MTASLQSSRRNAGLRAVVTGGTQGVGRAIALRLAAEGADAVVIAGRDERRGRAVEAELAALGTTALFVQTDVAVAADCEALIDTALARLGGLDGLVNAAGIADRSSLVDTTLEAWDRHFNTNARGPFLLMQGLVRHLLATGRPGGIVNIVSMEAHRGGRNSTPYSASKAALANLTRNTASAYARNRIRCNAILPGWMDTPGEDAIQKSWHGQPEGWLAEAERSMPMGQLAKPDQLAGLVAYMLSPESGVMTGALVDYDQTVVGA